MPSRLLCLFVALTAGGAVAKEPPATRDTPAQAAARVVRALAAGDAAALRALAARDDPDPWLVADELCALAAPDAAVAFAEAAPRVDVDALPAYVGSRRGRRAAAAAREALAAAGRALEAGRFADAMVAVGVADPAGDPLAAMRLLYARGLALRGVRRLEESAAALREAADSALAAGWLAFAEQALLESGASALSRADQKAAFAAWEAHLALAERRGHRAGVARACGNLGIVHQRAGAIDRALELQQRALQLMEGLGDRAGLARTLGNLGNLHLDLGEFEGALDFYGRALAIADELGDRRGAARTLGNLGVVHAGRGAYTEALEHQRAALRLAEELGEREGVARALGNLGEVHLDLGAYSAALTLLRRALEMKRELGDRGGAARTLGTIGAAYEGLGDYGKALEIHREAHGRLEEVGDLHGVAATVGNMGNLYQRLGAYAKALESGERALRLFEDLGDRAGVAAALGNLGVLHERLGLRAAALGFGQRALRLSEEVGDRPGVAAALGNLGNLYARDGAHAEALACQQRALRLMEELGDRQGIATTLGDIGNLHSSLGDPAAALAFHERALLAMEEVGDRAGIAWALGSIGGVRSGLGEHAEALQHQERAARIAGEVGASDSRARALWGAGLTLLAMGRPEGAEAKAREAALQLAQIAQGNADEHGASVRTEFRGVFDLGLRAAAKLGDATGAAFFLESGRAGALLETLKARDALQAAVLPPEFLAREREACARESAAAAALRRAIGGGSRAMIAACRAEHERSRAAVQSVVEQVERGAKAAANVLHQSVDDLPAMQARLREGEALLLYGLTEPDAFALVLTADDAAIVALGGTAAIEAACSAPDFATLRSLAVEPLRLDRGITRVLVSPDGALSYAPFALLLPGRETCCVPSGTVYGLLLRSGGDPGSGTLALGDPDYGAESEARDQWASLSGGGRLQRLPATAAEAKAVGEVVLLGGDATEAGLRAALAGRPRWRSVHFACHGLVDPERPMFSALALTPEGGEDGYLTALEVFRLRCPADLVVLSACDTARGKIYRAEGIVGLTRAFMFAGASRLLVSLWRVDDEATRALMERFYKEWRGGAGAATALLRGQQHVASLPRWNDPRYWAGWVLWGLPE